MAEPTWRDLPTHVLPTIFVAGPMKSGTTFLWDCIVSRFGPGAACGGFSPATSRRRRLNDPLHWSKRWDDEGCGARAFVLPPIASSTGEVCWHARKETPFVSSWGYTATPDAEAGGSVARYAGPSLPISYWAARRCSKEPLGFNADLTARCMADGLACSSDANGDLSTSGRGSSSGSSGVCACRPCHRHPGIDAFDRRSGHVRHEACASATRACVAPTCVGGERVRLTGRRRSQGGAYVFIGSGEASNHTTSSRRRRRRHLQEPPAPQMHQQRRFEVPSAFPTAASLATANISVSRVRTIEGNPSVLSGGGLGGMATALAALTTAVGRASLRFVVGVREPFDLALACWRWAARAAPARLARGPAGPFRRGLAVIEECDGLVGRTSKASAASSQTASSSSSSWPTALLALSDADATRHRACYQAASALNEAVDMLSGGLYALHLTQFLRAGVGGRQFLLVPTRALAAPVSLQAALATFLALPPLPSRRPDVSSGSRDGAAIRDEDFCRSPKNRNAAAAAAAGRLPGQNQNATLAAVQVRFRASQEGQRVARFYDAHHALLPELVAREGVSVVGSLT